MADTKPTQYADTVRPVDQPCGCRLGGPRDRLCQYHEGYQDGWNACWTDNVGEWDRTPLHAFIKDSLGPGCVCGLPASEHNDGDE